MNITPQYLEDLAKRFEKAAAETRGSLTPAIVKQLVDDIRLIKDKTILFEHLLKDTQEKVEPVQGLVTRVTVNEGHINDLRTTIKDTTKWIWGGIASVLVMGIGILWK